MYRLAIAWMALLLSIPSLGFAQDSLRLRLTDELPILAHNATYTSAAVSGHLLVTPAEYGWVISDVSNPDRPITRSFLSEVRNDGWKLFALSGRTLWLQNNGLKRYRVNSPSDIVFEYQMPMSISGMSASDQYLCIQKRDTLVVFDAATPDTLSELGRIVISGLYFYQGITLRETFLFCRTATDSIKIVSIIDPTHPELLSEFGPVRGSMTYEGGFVYNINPDSLSLYFVGDPEHPVLVGSFDVQGTRIAVERGLVAVSDGSNLIRLYSIRNELEWPEFQMAINQVGELRLESRYINALVMQNQFLYVQAWYTDVLTVIDLNDGQPSVRSTIGWCSRGGLFYHNQRLITIGDSTDRAGYRVDDGIMKMTSRGGVNYGYLGTPCGFLGDVLYSTKRGLYLTDASNPDSMQRIAYIELDAQEPVRKVALGSELSLAAIGGAGLDILDTSDPRHPEVIAETRSDTGFTGGLAVNGETGYWARSEDSLRLYTIDLREGHRFEVLDQVTLGAQGYSHLDYQDGVLFANSQGVDIFDVSDPTQITRLARIDSTNSNSTVLLDTLLFLCMPTGGIKVINVADPSEPVEVFRYADSRQIYQLVWGDGYLFASINSGLLVFHLDGWEPPASASDRPILPGEYSLSVYPNPFNGRSTVKLSLPELVNGRFVLVDPLGRRVQELIPKGWITPGEHQYCLNGSALPSGWYQLMLEGGPRGASVPVVITK